MADHNICDACETVAHCRRHGCIPLTPIAAKDGAAGQGQAGAVVDAPLGFALVPVEHDVHPSWRSMELAAARALTDPGFSSLTRKDIEQVNVTNVVRQIVKAAVTHRERWPDRWDFAAPGAAIAAREQTEVDTLRAEGWAVAVHNDYRLNGEPHTFWLFTKGDHAAKGEGRTDAEALAQVRASLASREEAPAASGQDQEISGDGWLLDSEGRRLVGTSHHYTAQSIKALIWELKALEDPRMTTQADFENRDWRAWCGILRRVLSGLASEVPFAHEAPSATPSSPQMPQAEAGAAVLQFSPMLNNLSGIAEPRLERIIWRYYNSQIDDQQSATRYATEYCEKLAAFCDTAPAALKGMQPVERKGGAA